MSEGFAKINSLGLAALVFLCILLFSESIGVINRQISNQMGSFPGEVTLAIRGKEIVSPDSSIYLSLAYRAQHSIQPSIPPRAQKTRRNHLKERLFNVKWRFSYISELETTFMAKWSLLKVSELHHGFRKAVERIINQGFFLSPLLNAKYDYDDGVVKGLLHNKYWVTKT